MTVAAQTGLRLHPDGALSRQDHGRRGTLQRVQAHPDHNLTVAVRYARVSKRFLNTSVENAANINALLISNEFLSPRRQLALGFFGANAME